MTDTASNNRAAAVGEVRRLVSDGATLKAALVAAGVSKSNYRRWAARLDRGGIAALANRSSKHHLPAPVRLTMRDIAPTVIARYRDSRAGQIGRYRGEMRRENLNWMKVLSGSADPRKYFRNYAEFSGNAAGCPAGSGALQGGPAVLGRVAA